jgi:hypothetical protein
MGLIFRSSEFKLEYLELRKIAFARRVEVRLGPAEFEFDLKFSGFAKDTDLSPHSYRQRPRPLSANGVFREKKTPVNAEQL